MTSLVRPSDADKLGIATRTLCSRWWTHEGLDIQLREVLGDCLSVLGASAVVARFLREGVSLSYSSPRSSITLGELQGLCREIGRRVETDKRDAFHFRLEGFHVVGAPVIEPINGGGTKSFEGSVGYAAVLFSTVPDDVDELQRFVAFHSLATSGLLFQVLHHRARLFLSFPPALAERYWTETLAPESKRQITPPWEEPQPRRTVTLGFDLRKSTFCMENADSAAEFARWLDQLAQILMAVAHTYGGIFDKFTGDGGLVHFLDAECHVIYDRSAVEQAVDCAVAMQKATTIHIGKLREFLRLDSKLLGGGIGIDVAPAHWSLDYRHNPITVGRGVVNACRLMDDTPARAVRLTNIAFRALPAGAVRELFTEIDFTSKEFGPQMKITAWQLMDGTTMPLGDPEVEQICRKVYERDYRGKPAPV